MVEIYFSKKKLREILEAIEKEKADGIFYAPRQVIYHNKKAPFTSLFTLTIADKRKEELEKIKKEIQPIVDDEDGNIYPIVVCLPLGFLEEDFEIAKHGIDYILEKTATLAREHGRTLDNISMEERLEILYELMKEGKLTYNEVFWSLVFHHALSGWSALKKWNEQKLNEKKKY